MAWGSLAPDDPIMSTMPDSLWADDARQAAAGQIAGRQGAAQRINQMLRSGGAARFMALPMSANVDDRRHDIPPPYDYDREIPVGAERGSLPVPGDYGPLGEQAGFHGIDESIKRQVVEAAWRRLADGLGAKEFDWKREPAMRDERFMDNGYLGSEYDVGGYYDAVGIEPPGGWPQRVERRSLNDIMLDATAQSPVEVGAPLRFGPMGMLGGR